jgi:nucleotide-binding universal stress UspA family protein
MKRRRVIVGFDAAAPLDRTALEAAAGITARIEGELTGLFVENIDLLHMAALPFTREVGFPSAASRELDVERMERALRAVAGEAHRMLGTIAAGARLNWSFRVTRGVFATELASAAEEADLVLVPGAAGGPSCAAPRIRVLSGRDRESLRAALRNRQGVMLALTGDADDAVERALRDWL